MDSQQFQVGDHVYVGFPRPGKVHWVIASLSADRTRAGLRSPMSGMARRVDTADLTLHTPTPTPAPAPTGKDAA